MLSGAFRSRLLISLAALTIGVSLLGLPAATAAPGPVTGLTGVPQPPKVVSVAWDAYTGFGVDLDHYEVTVEPGTRFQQVPDGVTSVLFKDLSWSESYTVTVVAVDGVGTKSEPAELKLRGTKLSGTVNPSIVSRGRNATVSGSLLWPNDDPIANAQVVVMRAFYPEPFPASKFKKVGTVTTNSKGRFALKTPALQKAQYRVLYLGQPVTTPTVGGWDSNITLSVTTPITFSMSPNPVRFGNQVRFAGKVQAPGTLVSGEAIHLQHKVSGKWKTVKSGAVKSDSSYSIKFQPRNNSDQAWRVTTGRSEYFAPSVSRPKVLVVR